MSHYVDSVLSELWRTARFSLFMTLQMITMAAGACAIIYLFDGRQIRTAAQLGLLSVLSLSLRYVFVGDKIPLRENLALRSTLLFLCLFVGSLLLSF